MDAAARPSGHKRGLSAYDSQLADFDANGKMARPSDEQAAQGECEQQQEEPQQEPALTEQATFNLTALREAQENVIRQMHELQEAGLTFLDNLRAEFLDRITAVKQEMAVGLNNVEGILRANSAVALVSRQRALTAGELVQRLGIRTQDVDAPDLFTGEQEGEAVELLAAE